MTPDAGNLDISGIGKAEALRRLYNHARPQGLGMLHFEKESMSVEEAQQLIDSGRDADGRIYFDYLKGRVLKVDLSGDSVSPRLYDRDNGFGAAEHALSQATEDAPEAQA